jgi:acyl CoA:acetate/3-ketoacid CoA transferase alpha subunit
MLEYKKDGVLNDVRSRSEVRRRRQAGDSNWQQRTHDHQWNDVAAPVAGSQQRGLAGGAGIPGYYTRTGFGTLLAESSVAAARATRTAQARSA